MPKKYELRIINTYNEAYETGAKYISNQTGSQRFSNDVGTLFPQQLMNPKWELTLESLSNTLHYIMDFLHHQCYMLCINNNNVLLCKLDTKTTAPVFKDVLEKSINNMQNSTMNHAQQKNVKETVTNNIDNLRVMQCIVKPFSETTKVENNEYLDLMRGLNLPNGVFILNLTDAVILRNDGKSPFTMVTGKTDLGKYNYNTHIPILSISGQRNYLDIPIPNYDDVMFVLKYPKKYDTTSGTHNRNKINPDPSYITNWDDKPFERGVFRGGPTGCGYTDETNMRIKLARMRSSLLDAKLTNKDGNTVDSKAIKFDPKYGIGSMNTNIGMSGNFLSMADQSQYKYIIHIDGNVNAYRLLTTMLTGSLILRVTSQYTSWVDHMIQHKVHFIPVKADLSDLLDVIRWCRQNDDKCREIANTGMEFARSILSKKYIQSYLQNTLWSLAEKRPVIVLNTKVETKLRVTKKKTDVVKKKQTRKEKITSKTTTNNKVSEKLTKKVATDAEKAAKKAAIEAEKLTKKVATEAEKAAKKAAIESEKAAKKAAIEAEKAAKKVAIEAEKAAKKVAIEAEKADKYEYIVLQPDKKKCPTGYSAVMQNGIKVCRKKKDDYTDRKVSK